jgi:CRISPR/Cas system-associated exonuclease Cas4 (RecB family)
VREQRLRQAQPNGDRTIRASEIGRYVYCAHAWWLGSVQGLPSAHEREMAAGEVAHQQHGRRVKASLRLNRVAVAVLLLAAVVGAVWLAGWLMGG